MFHVIYVSEAARPMSQADLLELLEVSRRRNARLLLTGLLLYADGKFMQVLEGKEVSVREVFDVILQDQRHSNVVTLKLEAKPRRHFPDWTMAFENLEGSVRLAPAVSQFLEPGFEGGTLRDGDEAVYQLLREFRNEHFSSKGKR